MIKVLFERQSKSKNVYFARRLTAALQAMGVALSPKVVATQFNRHSKSDMAKPHTVRKWLLGVTQPKSEALLLLGDWLKIDPKDLISVPHDSVSNKVKFEFNFTDQEVISKYLAMTVKQKVTVRLVIDAISEKQR